MAEIGTDIQKAVDELNRGNVVAVPTETVYGLAGNAFDVTAVAKIFEVKRRPSFDPLIVHIASYDCLDSVVRRIPEPARILAQALWPGPLTLVLPKADEIPELVTSGLSTVAVRVPDHPLTAKLLATLSFPLACPSANPFGYISPTSAQHVADQLGEAINYILDGGSCKVGIESTIVGFEDGQAVIYRPGGVPVESIEHLIGKTSMKSMSDSPLAPGMLKSHYSPSKSLILGNISELLDQYGHEQVGVLSFSRYFEQLDHGYQIQLSPTGNLTEAAQNLFASLRKLDSMNIRYIFAETVPEQGLGIAINNRLKRAAGGNAQINVRKECS